MGVYLGKNSCYARREGIYVKQMGHKGVDKYKEALGIIYLIHRDLRRGWTYEQGTCRKIRMTWALAERRLVFLLRLAKLHRMPRAYREKLRRVVERIIKTRTFPRTVLSQGKKAIARR